MTIIWLIFLSVTQFLIRREWKYAISGRYIKHIHDLSFLQLFYLLFSLLSIFKSIGHTYPPLLPIHDDSRLSYDCRGNNQPQTCSDLTKGWLYSIIPDSQRQLLPGVISLNALNIVNTTWCGVWCVVSWQGVSDNNLLLTSTGRYYPSILTLQIEIFFWTEEKF